MRERTLRLAAPTAYDSPTCIKGIEFPALLDIREVDHAPIDFRYYENGLAWVGCNGNLPQRNAQSLGLKSVSGLEVFQLGSKQLI